MKYNIRDILNKIDLATDNEYDLRSFYDITYLTKAERDAFIKFLPTDLSEESLKAAAMPLYNFLYIKMNIPNKDLSTVSETELEGTDAAVRFVELDSKQVPDSDGFLTDYTMYKDILAGNYVFVFGDKDLYRPEDENYDWETESEEAAQEWFDSYNGFEDEYDDSFDFDESKGMREGWNDYRFEVSCNDGPSKVIHTVANDEKSAIKYVKNYYAQEHITYADDRANKWRIRNLDTGSEYNESLDLEEYFEHDYSDIKEIEKLPYTQTSRPGILPILDVKKFKDALDSIGLNKFKIRTSRMPANVSLSDLKDEFSGNAAKPWHFSRAWDSSLSGFNEIYIFTKAINEDIGEELEHEDIVDWLSDHETAYEDAKQFFSDVPLTDVPKDDLIGWIADHEQLYNDFIRFFYQDFSDLDESKSNERLNESVVIGKYIDPRKEDYDDIEYSQYPNYDQSVKVIGNQVVDVKIYPHGNDLGHSVYWALKTTDGTYKTHMPYIYELKKFVDAGEIVLNDDWKLIDKYPYLIQQKDIKNITENMSMTYKGYTICTKPNDAELYIKKDNEFLKDIDGKDIQVNWIEDAKAYIDSLVENTSIKISSDSKNKEIDIEDKSEDGELGHPIKKGLGDPTRKAINESFIIVAVDNDYNKKFFNETTQEWVDSEEDATIYDDHQEALDTWFDLDKSKFKRVFVPIYEK